MPYLAVDDVDKRAEMAVEAGAKLMRIFDIPEVGGWLIIQPGGAGIGWITPVASAVAG